MLSAALNPIRSGQVSHSTHTHTHGICPPPCGLTCSSEEVPGPHVGDDVLGTVARSGNQRNLPQRVGGWITSSAACVMDEECSGSVILRRCEGRVLGVCVYGARRDRGDSLGLDGRSGLHLALPGVHVEGRRLVRHDLVDGGTGEAHVDRVDR